MKSQKFKFFRETNFSFFIRDTFTVSMLFNKIFFCRYYAESTTWAFRIANVDFTGFLAIKFRADNGKAQRPPSEARVCSERR